MMRMRTLRLLARVARLPRPDAEDVCALGGIAALAVGAALIYLPAGLIVLGLLLVVIAVGLSIVKAKGGTR